MINQIIIKDIAPGDILIHEDDEIKEFFIVVFGTFQQLQAGQKFDPKVNYYLESKYIESYIQIC